ncbi:MAG: glycoside hydrolase family 3 N-terminal domain-containing protein [Oscillibacter sp.]
MKRFLAALLAACCLCSLAACGETTPENPPAPPAEEEPLPPAPPPPPTEEERAAALLSTMTTAEKVGQLFFVRVPASDALADISAYHPGGYLLFGRDTSGQTKESLTATIAAYQTAAGAIPLLIGVDEEGGKVVRVSSNAALREKKFQSPQTLYAKGGLEAILADTREKDALLRELGFNLNLAPVADVSTHSKDFMYPRTLGQDAAETAAYVAAVVEQMQQDGMGSALKHFPGYGDNVDTHTGIATDKRTLTQFRESDFLPFAAGIAADVPAILVSHNLMTCVDETLPASLSPAVHALLREELGFTGVVMTDDLAMEAVAAYAGDGSVAELALRAGNDLIITTDYRTQIPKVLAAVDSGALDEELINAACIRVLVLKMRLGLLEI